MYVKLFSRITESSLMEEAIPVRYTFVMLLAIADPEGLVVGTDIAIARRLNMPLADFIACIDTLRKEDPHSNSKEEEGRRLIESEGERGYQIVNFVKYRDMKDEDQRRSYMRDYMRDYRGGKLSVNTRKHPLTQEAVAATEAEEAKVLSEVIAEIYELYPKKVGKPAACKAIARALKTCDEETLKLTVKRYADAVLGHDVQFIPYPSTWFNQERYNDDPSTWVKSKVPVSTSNGFPPSLRDLKTVLQTKELLAAEIENRHCTRTAMTSAWDVPAKRAEWQKLRGEIKALQQRISNFV